MKLLLDTHCWLWALGEPEKLSDETKALLLDPQNYLLLSAASLWEIAIKLALNRPDFVLPAPLESFFEGAQQKLKVEILPVMAKHAFSYTKLPTPKEHRDPFDRMLVAQAQTEQLFLLTDDPNIKKYYPQIAQLLIKASPGTW